MHNIKFQTENSKHSIPYQNASFQCFKQTFIKMKSAYEKFQF